MGTTRLLILLAGLLVAAVASAAPDEEALGRAEGYPVCPPAPQWETRCLVGSMSHYDTIFPARRVARGTTERRLRCADSTPEIRYTCGAKSVGLDDYLARNRTTALLILKGDTILVERYQYDRKPEQRLVSHSMAKSIVAMLVGIALSERAIQSIDDLAETYVPELKGTPYGQTSLRHLLTMSSGVEFAEGITELGYIGVNARVRDYARFGMLLANDGTLDGRSIIPARWVREATSPVAPHFPVRMFAGYGYQTWIVAGPERQFALIGLRGQAVLIDPKSQLVMVHTAAREIGDPGWELIALWTAVVRTLGGRPELPN